MRSLFEKSKNLTFTDTTVTIKSALNQESLAQIDAMAAELCRESQGQPAEPEASSAPRKQFVCSVCGWIYEGDALPSDIVCPLCKQGANVFEEVSQ
jgi:rubredoxin